jgi:hypothetical protein
MADLYGDERNNESGKPDVVTKVRRHLANAFEHDRDNRVEASEDLNFLAGNQWPETVRRERETEGRPVLTINRLPQFVRQVTNDIRQADVAIRVSPTDGAVARAEQVRSIEQEMRAAQQGGQGPAKVKPMTMADVMDGLIREIQYQSSASHAYATAAEHQVSCGIGHFRIMTDYVDEFSLDQCIKIKPIQRPLSVYWDPAAVEIDRSDAQWCIVTDLIPESAFKEQYPDAVVQEVEHFEERSSELYWTTADTVRIAEYWCKKPVTKEIVQMPDGQIVDLSQFNKADRALIQEEIEFNGLQVRKVKTHKVEQYIVSGAEILEGPTEWPGKNIPIIPVIGSEIPVDDKVMRHGLIRFARDPQQLYNYARTSAAESMGQAPRAPWLVTPAMIKPFKNVWDTAHKSLRPYLPYQPDADVPQGPQRMPPPDIPAAYASEAQISDGDIKATVGIYDPQLGERSNEQSGKAILAREAQGDTGTFHYSDNLRRALEYAGRQLVEIIPKIYDSERIVRILGEDDSEYFVPINTAAGYDADGEPIYINDMTNGRYDCRVTIGPSYATKRTEAAESMFQFIQAFPPAAQLAGDLIASNMDWPGADAIAERLRRAVPPEVLGEDAPPQEPDPMQQMAQELEMRNAQATVAKTEAEAEKAQAQSQQIMAGMQEMMAKIELIAAQIAHTQAQTAKTAVEAELAPAELIMKGEDTAEEFALKYREQDLRLREKRESNRGNSNGRQ